MGRITLFTSHHCLYSLQLKQEFKKRNIPFEEINITDFPDKRQDLFQLTRRMTTPQAFFNTRYVGGCEATLRLLKEWDNDRNFNNAAKKYEAQIGRFPDPSNPHLAIPTATAAGASTREGGEEEGSNHDNTDNSDDDSQTREMIGCPIKPVTVELQLPTGSKTYGVSELQEELERILPLSNLPYHLTSYKNSVTGTQATKALMEYFECKDREEAEGIGKQLNDLGILHHCCYDHDFFDTPKLFYRLQCHQTPNILNSFYILEEEIIDNDIDRANALVERMEYLLQQLELECFDMDHGGIQYSRGRDRATYRELQEALCHFQTIGFDFMLPKQLLAFGLNVYNVMQRFAFFKCGIPKKETYQQQFLRDIKFNVGGNLYSFYEWISQISAGKICNEQPMSPTGVSSIRRASRGSFTSANPDSKKSPIQRKKSRNTSQPLPTKRPVKRSKSKYRNSFTAFDLASMDYRVYFATNFFRCRGTAITHFTPKNIEKELTIMALAFVADDTNVVVDTARGELHLSNIFDWYRKDFNSNSNLAAMCDDSSVSSNSGGTSDKDLTHLVFQYMESPKKLQLQQLMYSGNGKKLKVCFHSDDWTVNATEKDCIGFTPAFIEANCPRF